jgi:GR25 family glycosyltransferase involved in LPS biosynthesis
MIHLVVINLKKRSDRWESLSQHLKDIKSHLGFIHSIHRMEAIEYNPPSKGCMLSHAKAIRWAKDQHWDSVMVVEDDVRFCENIDSTWNAVQSELESTPWSVLFGGSVRIRPRDVKKHSAHTLALRAPDGIFTGTHCMVYHSRAYDDLIRIIETEVSETYPFHLDLLISSKCSPIILTVPYLALFKEMDTSDVRVGRDTKIDYQNIIDAQKTSLTLMDQ